MYQIFVACLPRITVTGLTASSTPDIMMSSVELCSSGGLNSTSNTDAGTLRIHSWGRASGDLVMEVVLDIDGALTNSSGTTAFDFDFKLLNPSLHQDAPGVGLELSYFHRDTSSRNAWTNAATNNGAHKVIAGGGVGLDLTSANYPMKISAATVTSSIRQSRFVSLFVLHFVLLFVLQVVLQFVLQFVLLFVLQFVLLCVLLCVLRFLCPFVCFTRKQTATQTATQTEKHTAKQTAKQTARPCETNKWTQKPRETNKWTQKPQSVSV